MEDNEFWVAIWKLIAIGLAFIVASISSCVSYDGYLTSKAADPIAYQCSRNAAQSQIQCMTVIAREKK